jgi:hypothetical protein
MRDAIPLFFLMKSFGDLGYPPQLEWNILGTAFYNTIAIRYPSIQDACIRDGLHRHMFECTDGIPRGLRIISRASNPNSRGDVTEPIELLDLSKYITNPRDLTSFIAVLQQQLIQSMMQLLTPNQRGAIYGYLLRMPAPDSTR